VEIEIQLIKEEIFRGNLTLRRHVTDSDRGRGGRGTVPPSLLISFINMEDNKSIYISKEGKANK